MTTKNCVGADGLPTIFDFLIMSVALIRTAQGKGSQSPFPQVQADEEGSCKAKCFLPEK